MKYFTLILLICLFFACGTKTGENNTNAEKRQYTEQKNPVEVIVLQKNSFKKELVNNGKLVALRKSELQFRVGEQLEKLNFRNGDDVKASQVIAELTPFTYRQQLANAQIQQKRARLEMQDLLIGQGYNTMDTTKIPSHIYEMASVKSGYAEAVQSLETAKFNLESTRLVAPFNGKLANMTQKQYDRVNTGTTFCTLIDDSEFEAEFRIVESEANDIRLGSEVQLIPFSVQTVYKGRISEINPVIDANGLILVKALVKNPGGLLDGMNVKVLVEKEIPDQLVVPKSAVLLRDNQEVLFKCTHDTIAFWTYIQTIGENTTSYSIIAHPDKGATLESGDTIIISGNLNLAHESKVSIK
ncbi:MAG: efflux RND transporter periplasmic adaptor subunit [Bacteroidota bacterium]|nr:efflux RND transporter periplasmic adaptor subunit [Bacteroidota bacterium]